MNYNNLAQKTNWTASSPQFPLVPFYLTSLNIPGLNFSLPEVGGRYGSKIHLGNDSVSFNTFNFEFLIDEDFQIYNAFYEEFVKTINLHNGTFADRSFDFWVELANSKGNKIMKLEFYNCRLESIGDINLDTTSSETEFLLSVSLKFDYYEIIKQNIPTQVV